MAARAPDRALRRDVNSMHVVEPVRRLAGPAAALVGAAAICVACTNSTGGTPANPGGGGASASSTSSSRGGGSLTGGPSLSLPSLTDVPTIGSGGAPFCKEFDTGDLSGLGSSGDLSKVLDAWDKFAADAPSDIKPDFQKVDDYLHALSTGTPPTSTDAQALSTAAQHIGVWIAQNCSGG